MAILRVTKGAAPGRTIELTGEITLGREAGSVDHVINDPEVSRRHAVIRQAQGALEVEDLGSANGTYVDGQRIKGPVLARAGARIVVGNTELVVEGIAPDQATRRSVRRPQTDHDTTRPSARRAPIAVPRPAPDLPVGPAAAVVSDGGAEHPAAAVPDGGAVDRPTSKPRRRPVASTDLAGASSRGPRSFGRRWREARLTRAALPDFPNYTQIPSLLSFRAWWVVRACGLVATAVVIVLLIAAPATGLKVMWGIAIPLLPILFLVAPGLWRNICPLAAANQTPRLLGMTRAGEPPAWLRRAGYWIAISTFAAVVTLRKVGLQTSGVLSGLLLVAALGGAFAGGLLLKGKSGWCSSICPLLPVQRVYGQTPFALIGNSHCQPCVGCTKNCYDFNPRPAYLADLQDPDVKWVSGRKFFIAAFPGLVLGFFEVGNVPAVSAPSMYGQLALYVAASIAVFVLADSLQAVGTHKLTTVYAAAALNIFYWFAFPGMVKALTGATSPTVLTWAVRAILASLTVWWIARTYLKERAFVRRSHGAQLSAPGGRSLSGAARSLSLAGRSLSLAASRSIGAHTSATAGRPEVTFLPDGKRIAAEAGRTLLEVAEANGLSLEAGCRMGVCGADPVAIVNGMANLSSVSDDERATLERLGLAENTRMACCCRVKGPVMVSLKPDQPGRLTPSQILRLNYDRSVERVVVIGNGIAGITAADYVRRNHPECAIEVIGDESHQLYNRMAITRLIYGRSAMQGLYLNPETWCESRNIELWLNTRAVAIDRDAGEVALGSGERLRYDRLILAAGSSSFVPPISGWGAPGTFVLRSADDALAIRAFVQAREARHGVVAGGGLLGLEAAFALHKLGLSTTVLEISDRLLPRQLDERASVLLRRCIEGLGIDVLTGERVTAVSHDGRIDGVVLADARAQRADVLIVAAGIAPNVELARAAGLETARGVVVDEHMRTSDERIFAAGDVAQFGDGISGLWPTAVEQARVAAEAAVATETTPYRGTLPVTVLKVSGVELTSIGRFEPASEDDEVIVHDDEAALRYAKLVISDGRIAGAILLGYSLEVAPITSAVKQGWEVGHIVDDLRAGRWNALEQLGGDRSLSAVSVVGLGAA